MSVRRHLPTLPSSTDDWRRMGRRARLVLSVPAYAVVGVVAALAGLTLFVVSLNVPVVDYALTGTLPLGARLTTLFNLYPFVGSAFGPLQGGLLVTLGLQAIDMVVQPQFARLYAQGDRYRLQQLTTHAARGIVMLALPVVVTYLLVGEQLLEFVFGEEYRRGYLPLAIVAAGQLVKTLAGPAGMLLNMTGHEKDTMRGIFLSAGTNIVLNISLIPIYGMTGAAIATFASFVVWSFGLSWITNNRMGIRTTVFHV